MRAHKFFSFVGSVLSLVLGFWFGFGFGIVLGLGFGFGFGILFGFWFVFGFGGAFGGRKSASVFSRSFLIALFGR